MMEDLHTALTAPFELIDTLYQRRLTALLTSSSMGSSSSAPTTTTTTTTALQGFETDVQNAFGKLFEDRKYLVELPIITSASTSSTLPALGTLVRFRAMVQDTGYGSELYRAIRRKTTTTTTTTTTEENGNGKKYELFMFGKDEMVTPSTDFEDEEEKIETEVAYDDDDYSNLKERQGFYIVSVPGENEWVKKTFDQQPLQKSLAFLSMQESSSSSTTPSLLNKYPIPSEQHFGCIAKVYGEAADNLKSTDVYEFIGILGETHLSDTFDELAAQSGAAPAPSTPVPALHAILSLPVPSAVDTFESTTQANVTDLRAELIEYISTALHGDKEAAEWVSLALLSRIHTRHPTGLALGSLSLNLAFPTGKITENLAQELSTIISSLVPNSTHLSLTIPSLNIPTTRMAPRTIDESLQSGSLQLAKHTVVVVDTLSIGEGQLVDTGVKNLRYLATNISQQKLTYSFPYAAFELETDTGFIVVSEGKAIVPTDCVVHIQTQTESSPQISNSTEKNISEEKLTLWRQYLQEFKFSDLKVNESISEVIQTDFVERRSKSIGGEGMTQDDLVFRMTAGRLMALSLGQRELTTEAWERIGRLDDSRKDRGVIPIGTTRA